MSAWQGDAQISFARVPLSEFLGRRSAAICTSCLSLCTPHRQRSTSTLGRHSPRLTRAGDTAAVDQRCSSECSAQEGRVREALLQLGSQSAPSPPPPSRLPFLFGQRTIIGL